MQIKGLQKLTLIDYPEQIAATIFLAGCNFKCPYCHNPELVTNSREKDKKTKIYREKEIINFLKERKGFIDGVCITGGEPTLHKELPSFIKKIKKLNYAVKLDTNGTNPEMLKQLLKEKIIDYIAMDIKAPLEKYDAVVNAAVNMEDIKQSITIIKKFKNHEFRTTVSPDLDENDIVSITKTIKGAKAFYLQKFVPKNCLNKNYDRKKGMQKQELEEIKNKIKKSFETCEVRAGE